MTGGQRYRKILSALIPVGTFGMTIVLGSAAQAAREAPSEPAIIAPPAPTAERLAAIRDAVSDLAAVANQLASPPDGTEQLAWGNWGNGGGFGIGIGGFGIGIGVPAWNDWHNGWRNWSNNWHNGWNNWGNGWRNY